MEADDLARLIDDLIEANYSRVDRLNESKEAEIWNTILRLLNSPDFALELYPSGIVKPTGKNIQKINGILKKLEPILYENGYLKAQGEVLSSTTEKLAEANESYFTAIKPKFAGRPVYRDLVQTTNDRVLSVLNKNVYRESVMNAVEKSMKNFYTTGSTFDVVAKQFQADLVTSYDQSGDLVSQGYIRNMFWAKRITRDAAFSFVREYHQIATTDLGLQWGKYSGGLVRDSRSFCEKRARKYFTRNEVESWSGDKWQGKSKGTNKNTIFTLLGGYNCRHTFIPVDVRVVPKSAIDKAIKDGYYKSE